MRKKLHNNQIRIALLLKMKKEKKKNAIKDENNRHETFIQRTQNNHDRDMYDINNKSVKSVSGNKIIKKKE